MSSIEGAAEVLMSLTPGRVPLEIFNEIARLSVVPVVEVVIVSRDEVLFLKRQEDDLFWSNQYSLPGKIISSSGPHTINEYVSEVRSRLDIVGQGDATFSGCKIYKTKRGVELAMVYVLEVDTVPRTKDGYYFIKINDVDKFDIIPEHKDMVKTFL